MVGSKTADLETTDTGEPDTGLPAFEVPEYAATEPPNTLDDLEKKTWLDQNSFLRPYANNRTKATSARVACIGRSTVYWWEKKDHLGFKARLAEAEEAYCNMLEDKATALAMELKPGQNSLILVTLLNANMPDKYRPNSVLPSETMTETLQAMKQATREFKRLEDGSETTTETETVVIKKGLIHDRELP